MPKAARPYNQCVSYKCVSTDTEAIVIPAHRESRLSFGDFIIREYAVPQRVLYACAAHAARPKAVRASVLAKLERQEA